MYSGFLIHIIWTVLHSTSLAVEIPSDSMDSSSKVRIARTTLPIVSETSEIDAFAVQGPVAIFPADGAGTVAGAPPGTQVYRNVIGGDLLIYRPGANQRMADDMNLAPGACNATYYSLRVAGLNQGGGPTFDVQTALWTGDPCLPGSLVIAGTQQTFSGVPNNQSVFDLETTLDPMVPIPATVWLAATFSTNDSGWVRAAQAEVGSTSNLWSENHVQQDPNDPNDPPTGCGARTFQSSWGGFWAQINCNIPGNPMGACCNGITCTQATQANCGAGVWQGAFTTCNPNVCLTGACCSGPIFASCLDTTEDQCTGGLFHPGGICSLGSCGPTFKVYENNFNTGILDIIDPGTKWADDLSLGSGAPCPLAGYEVLFAGDERIGPTSFNVHLELWTNNNQGTPGALGDDLPAALIAGTGADFLGVPANRTAQRLLAGPYSGIALPPNKRIWVVMSTNVSNAGPLPAGPASLGFSVDGFAIFNDPEGPNVWTGGFWYDGFDPEGCPGSTCSPAGSFRITLWCEGEAPTGACCSDSSGTCTNDVREIDCDGGRWREGMDCGPETFEPDCGASACCHPIFIPHPVMQCMDTTPDDCLANDGVSKPGKFCGPDNVQCPDYDCLYHTGDCFAAHAGVGCDDAFCCDVVCDAMTGDPTCCSNAWNNACAQDALAKCDQPIQNDTCAQAKAISNTGVTGVFPFENTDATTDGPVHLACSTLGGDEQITKDVWFCWTANCTTQVLARTCGTTAIDSKIAVYQGCTCPPTDQRLRDCDDDRCGAAQSMAAFDAVAGQQYLIRVGSYPGLTGGVGSLTISCGPPNHPACPSVGGESCCTAHAQNVEACGNETCCETVCLCDPFCCTTEWDVGCAGNGYSESGCGAAQLCDDLCTSCPAGSVSWISPPSGTVDGRRPFPPNSPAALEGFKNFTVDAPSGSHRVECWDLCETDSLPAFPNAIESILDDGRNRYTVRLVRPITPGAVTTLTHLGSGASGTFIAHPANVNSDSAALPSDIIDLIDHLNGIRTCPGTQTPCPLQLWQCDIDRTGVCLPADIINLIDLLTGINGYRVWNGTTRPATAGVCP